jgi:predicted acylesterase/phospholipase RssA
MCALVLLWGGAAVAQEPPGAAEAPPAIGVVLSGGVSLGAYEAGFAHDLIGDLRRRGTLPRVMTGTSAGSINAFVGALEACSDRQERPTESLLWQIWIPMGLDKLFVPHETSAVAALSRAGFAGPLSSVKQRFLAGLEERCDVTLGFAVTRAKPRQIPLGSEKTTTIPRMTEHVLLRLKGNGIGKRPTLENATTRDLGRHHMFLPLDGADADVFEAITSSLLASSGFPLAFPPQPIAHCEFDLSGSGPLPACTKQNARPADFVDGGIFDNRPIAIALSLLDALTVTGGDSLLAFIDPELRAWPVVEEGPGPRNSPLAVVVGTLIDFISTARSSELDRLLAHDPTVEQRLRPGRLYYPPASDPLGAFFGFVDEELRRFDFYLGMYHARRFRIRELGETEALVWHEGDPRDPAWRPLFCMHAVFDRVGDAGALYGGDELSDFRALVRHAIERVAEDCFRAGPERAKSDHPVCMELGFGGYPFSVPGVDNGYQMDRGLPRYRRRSNEAESDWTLRRLAQLGFRFKDLGLKKGQGDRAPIVLRGKLGEIVDALAARQGALASHLYRVIGETGLNLIKYAPPRHLLHVLLGNRLEVGYSWTEPTSRMRWLRLGATFALWGLDTLFSDAPIYFGIAPMLGIELEPIPISRSLLQPRLGLHAGFVFSTGDRFLGGSCDVTAVTPCSRPIAQADLSVSLISVLRLQLSAVWFPPIHPAEKNRWSITPGIALQLPFGRVRR